MRALVRTVDGVFEVDLEEQEVLGLADAPVEPPALELPLPRVVAAAASGSTVIALLALPRARASKDRSRGPRTDLVTQCYLEGSRNSPWATVTALPPTSTRSICSPEPSARANSVDGRAISAPWEISISSPKPIRPWRAR